MAPESLGLPPNMRQCEEFIVIAGDGYHPCYLDVMSAEQYFSKPSFIR